MRWNALALIVAPQEGGQGLGPMLFMWVAIIAIFYFLLIRPQRKAQKQHQALLESLERGDRVMTDGGIIGEIVHLREDEVTIKTDGDTRLVIARQKIARVFGREQQAAD